jgi:hypothetical protein
MILSMACTDRLGRQTIISPMPSTRLARSSDTGRRGSRIFSFRQSRRDRAPEKPATINAPVLPRQSQGYCRTADPRVTAIGMTGNGNYYKELGSMASMEDLNPGQVIIGR